MALAMRVFMFLAVLLTLSNAAPFFKIGEKAPMVLKAFLEFIKDPMNADLPLEIQALLEKEDDVEALKRLSELGSKAFSDLDGFFSKVELEMAGPHGVFFRKLHHDVIVPLKERYEAWESQNGVEQYGQFKGLLAICGLECALDVLKGSAELWAEKTTEDFKFIFGVPEQFDVFGIFKKDENGSLVQESP